MMLTDDIEVLNADCMDIMRQYPDKHFDVAVVDPPYGINIGTVIGGGGKPFGKGGRGKVIPPKSYRGFDDSQIPDKKYFEELARVSREQIIWGGNYFIEHLKNTPCMIVWDKDNSGNFADCELAWTSYKTAVRKFKYRWNGMLQQNMKNKETRIHPTHKPIALYEWIFKTYCDPGFKILDTHGGSMSSVIAADRAGLKMVCCEKDPEYFAAAVERFTQYKSQLTIQFQ